MTRWLLNSVCALALAVSPAAAQTATTAKPAPQTQKPSTAKPAAPATAKPAPATAKRGASTRRHGEAVRSWHIRAFHDESWQLHRAILRQGRADHRAELRRACRGQKGVDRPEDGSIGATAVLQQPDLPPHHSEVHDSGRRSSQEPAPAVRASSSTTRSARSSSTIAPASCRWPTPVRIRTAASSSSPSLPYPSLDGKYSIFGEVVEGLDNRHGDFPGANDRTEGRTTEQSR